MQCEDNSKLRTPLNEVCMTTDIGCVPIVTGKPTCSPQPDELPIAYDKTTSTLWLFSCDTREWISFSKFTMCQLNALNLDNIKNICDVLNIGVNYAGSGECVQGTITLGELAQRILECLQLETKIVTIGQGEGNKVKITIEGLPLDPVYVQGENIWSEGGSGTEADPLVVATYDPICKWPIKNESQVSAATTKHLGACLDGEMSRVPFPPKICELPSRTQAQVDTARSVELAACVDGQGVKIPYVKPSPPVCESDQLTLDQVKSKGGAITLVACDNGNTVRVPVFGSGFFDRDYICVPETVGVPSGVPAQGTGPLRVDCAGNLYVWLCDSQKWLHVRDGIEGLSQLNPNNVPNICDNFRMKGWYSSNSDPCVQDVWFNLRQLASMVADCSSERPIVFSSYNLTAFSCYHLNVQPGRTVYYSKTGELVQGTYVSRDDGSEFIPRPQTAVLTVTNPFNVSSLVDIRAKCAANTSTPAKITPGSASCTFYFGPDVNFPFGEDHGFYERNFNICILPIPVELNFTSYSEDVINGLADVSMEAINFTDVLGPKETKTYNAFFLLGFNSIVENPQPDPPPATRSWHYFHVWLNAQAIVHRGVTTNKNYSE